MLACLGRGPRRPGHRAKSLIALSLASNVIGMGLAVLLRDAGHERIRLCASPDCGRALIDLTRNRSRRYCDAQCANRQHVAAYRQRHANTEP